MSRAVARAMRAAGQPGSIVNLGSEASSIGMPHYVAYCASKAGVLGLTRAMAAELAPHIRVNALCPGPVDTPMLRAELALSGEPDKAWEAEVGPRAAAPRRDGRGDRRRGGVVVDVRAPQRALPCALTAERPPRSTASTTTRPSR